MCASAIWRDLDGRTPTSPLVDVGRISSKHEKEGYICQTC